MKRFFLITRNAKPISYVLLCLLQTAFIRGADQGIATPGIGTLGNTFTLEPFALRLLGASSIRYQQVYSASEFSREVPEGCIINELIFRADEQTSRGFITAYPSVQVNLSVTPKNPDELSTVFAENVGAFSTIVYPLGILQLSGGSGTATTIPLSTPYAYYPADGNLLLDFMIFAPERPPVAEGTIASAMDAENNGFGPDTVSRVFAYDVNSTTGTADTIGLVTFFRVTPIPEPSIATLLFAALVAGACGLGHLRKLFNR